jgi:hypothetical protein
MPNLTPEERARLYLEELERLEAAGPTAKVVPQEKSSGLAGVIIVGVSLFLTMVIIALYSSRDAQPPLSESEKLQHGCQVVKLTLGDKPISQLSMDDFQQIHLCQSLGYYK